MECGAGPVGFQRIEGKLYLQRLQQGSALAKGQTNWIPMASHGIPKFYMAGKCKVGNIGD